MTEVSQKNKTEKLYEFLKYLVTQGSFTPIFNENGKIFEIMIEQPEDFDEPDNFHVSDGSLYINTNGEIYTKHMIVTYTENFQEHEEKQFTFGILNVEHRKEIFEIAKNTDSWNNLTETLLSKFENMSAVEIAQMRMTNEVEK